MDIDALDLPLDHRQSVDQYFHFHNLINELKQINVQDLILNTFEH